MQIKLGDVLKIAETVLLSRVTFIGNFMPISIGFNEAEPDNRMKKVLYVVATLAVMLRFSWLVALKFLCSAILFWVICNLVGSLNFPKKNVIYVGLFVSAFAVEIIWNLFDTLLVYDVIIALMKGVAVMFGYRIFSVLELQDIAVNDTEFLWKVFGIGILLLGMSDFNLFTLSLRNVICIYCILSFANVGGIKYSTVAGLILGAIIEFSEPNMGVSIISFALGGFLAGLFYRKNKLFMIWGFLLGNSVLAYYITGYNLLVMKFMEIALAGSIFYGATRKKLNILPVFDLTDKPMLIPSFQTTDTEVSKTLADSSEQFENISDFISGIEVEEDENDDVFERIKEKICNCCENFECCWDREYDRTSDEIFTVVESLEENAGLTAEEFQRFVNSEVCPKRAEILDEITLCYNEYRLKKDSISLKGLQNCMANQLKGFSQYISEISNKISESSENIEKRILHSFEKENVALEKVDVRVDDDSYRVMLKSKVPFQEKFLSLSNRILSQILNRRMDVTSTNREIAFFQECNRYVVLSAVLTRNADGENILGDSYKILDEEDNKYIMVLSDGMGVGEEANKISSSLVNLFAEMERSGLNPGTVTNMLSSFMQYISKSEKIITVDAMTVDLLTGECDFFKIGGAPSFIIRKDSIDIVCCDSLPLGILDRVDFFEQKRMLEPGDIVVTVSDGVVDSKRNVINKEFWISGFLKELEMNEPEVIAEELLEKTIENYGGVVKDDITIIVQKLVKG
ncbi:MAG: SpoIIE family protein phosphatase [Clostridia bacterium]|nr:SpoIIE family protein phosphatase [Clostridia bacterium]